MRASARRTGPEQQSLIEVLIRKIYFGFQVGRSSTVS